MAGDTVGLTDIVARLPALVMDAPVVVARHAHGIPCPGVSQESIGRVFQERAAHYGDQIFIRFDDEALTYRDANQTVNRYAAMLAERGVGRGDVVGIMMRNSPSPVLVMLAVVKLGAIAGMLNHKQSGQRAGAQRRAIGCQIHRSARTTCSRRSTNRARMSPTP